MIIVNAKKLDYILISGLCECIYLRFRMGNLRGWGGPLPQSWHAQQISLQHKILQRMRDFGMVPILPAFNGDVPNALTRLYPKAKVTHLSDWGGFNATYCW